MSFDGPALSFDDEGSILFDGEKIIVNVPVGHELLEHIGSEENIPFPVVYTHPSHAQNQQTSSEQKTGQASSLDSSGQGSTGSAPREIRPPARVHRQPILVPPDLLDINADALGSLDRHIAALNSGQFITDVDQSGIAAGGVDSSSPVVTPGWQGYTPLTPLQEEQVDHLLSGETDYLAREVLLGLKREGMPSDEYISDFMSQYAEWGWDDLSSALAMQVLEIVRNSDWDEWLGHADTPLVEGVAQDLGNNTREGLVIFDAKTWDILLDVTGVVAANGSQYVGLQDTEVEALKGLELVFVHNHTEEVGASDEDLESAFDAGAEVLIVIMPSGREQVYLRGRDRMVKVRDEQASSEIAPPTAAERREVRERSEKQAAVFEVDSPEFIFRQEEQYWGVYSKGILRLYKDEEAILRSEVDIELNTPLPDGYTLIVLDQSPSHPYAVKILAVGTEFWIDLRDPDAKLLFERVDLPSQDNSRRASRRAQVSGQEYDNTSDYFVHSLREVQRNPQAIGLITVPGTLRIYTDEEFDPNVDTPFAFWTDVNSLMTYTVLRYSELNPSAALIDINGHKYWMDTSNPDAEFTVSGLVEQSEEYILQSIVGDDETVPVAMSWPPYDASKIGLISTDYNKISDIYKPFQVQSPVVGPDVRVEFVVPVESNDTTTLGNYVVISFPASVYLENETIMGNWPSGPNHPSSLWQEDGRIFIAYGHLSEIHEDVHPGKIIDSQDKAIIGKTGNTGLTDPGNIHPVTKKQLPYKNTQDYHDNQHLDLAIVYFGSNMPEEMAAALEFYRPASDDPQGFFGYVLRSTLFQSRNNDNRLYGQNIDPDNIPGLFYVSTEPSR